MHIKSLLGHMILLLTLASCSGNSLTEIKTEAAENSAIPVFLLTEQENTSIYFSLRNLGTGQGKLSYCVQTSEDNCLTPQSRWVPAQKTVVPGIFSVAEKLNLAAEPSLVLRAEMSTEAGGIKTRKIKITSGQLRGVGLARPSAQECESFSSRFVRKTFALPEPVNIGNEQAYTGNMSRDRDWYNFAELHPIVTKVNDNGEVYVGWMGRSGQVHIDKYSPDLNIKQNVAKFNATRLRDIYVDKDGVATLSLDSNRMAMRYFKGNNQVWRREFIVRDYSSKMHNGRLARMDNGQYAAYFGVHGMGGHEGDALQVVNAQGEIVNSNAGWTWGCSHSIDQRLSFVDGQLISICLSDYYPSGIAYGKSKNVIVSDVRHYNGLNSGNLGGMVSYKGHHIVAYSSIYQRPGNKRDVALAAFRTNGGFRSLGQKWMTETSNTVEDKPKISLYENNLLLMYTTAENQFTFQLLDVEFRGDSIIPKILKEETVNSGSLEIGQLEDVASGPNNDVYFAQRLKSEPGQMVLNVLRSCR